jgi:ABC-type lipoprotein export system ATPase subunit
MMNDTAQLRLEGVWMKYPAVGTAEPVATLRGVDLVMERGESLAVVGPSGSGKTTLLNIIGTLERPTAGSVILDGVNAAGLDDRSLAKLRNEKIGFIFQDHHLLPQCTVLENVLVPTIVKRSGDGDEGDALSRARELLGRVGLGDRLDHRPGQLSGGQRQRVAVVRAMINEPGLLLADEPTGSLDRSSAGDLAELLAELNVERRLTLIVVTHTMELARRMGRMVELADGVLRDVEHPTA